MAIQPIHHKQQGPALCYEGESRQLGQRPSLPGPYAVAFAAELGAVHAVGDAIDEFAEMVRGVAGFVAVVVMDQGLLGETDVVVFVEEFGVGLVAVFVLLVGFGQNLMFFTSAFDDFFLWVDARVLETGQYKTLFVYMVGQLR